MNVIVPLPALADFLDSQLSDNTVAGTFYLATPFAQQNPCSYSQAWISRRAGIVHKLA